MGCEPFVVTAYKLTSRAFKKAIFVETDSKLREEHMSSRGLLVTIFAVLAYLASMTGFAEGAEIQVPQNDPNILGIKKLLPPLVSLPFFSPNKWIVREIRGAKGKKPLLHLECQGNLPVQGLVVNGKAQKAGIAFWDDGTTHVFPESIAFAGYRFDPDAGSDLVFQVAARQGYVYVAGKGKVTTPRGETILLDSSKAGRVIGEPTKPRLQ
jgi:hypothetical protein